MLSQLLQKLLFVRQFSINEGKIEIMQSRYIMLDASALLALQDIDETKVYKMAKDSALSGITSLVEHAKVYKKIKDLFVSNIAELGKKIGKTDEGMLTTLQEIFNIYGLGRLEIAELDNKGRKAVLKVRESSIAQEYIMRKKGEGKATNAKNPVCALTAGILAGMFSYILGKNVECIEAKCLAQGNSECVFKVG